MAASLPMWKDSWEIIAAQPGPGLNKGPAVEQEVTSGTAQRRHQPSSPPGRQSVGGGKSKLTLIQQSLWAQESSLCPLMERESEG